MVPNHLAAYPDAPYLPIGVSRRLTYADAVARWWPKTSVVLTTTQLRGEPMYHRVVEPAWWQWRLPKQVRRNRLC